MNFAKFVRTPFLTEHLRWLLLKGGTATQNLIAKQTEMTIEPNQSLSGGHNSVIISTNKVRVNHIFYSFLSGY